MHGGAADFRENSLLIPCFVRTGPSAGRDDSTVIPTETKPSRVVARGGWIASAQGPLGRRHELPETIGHDRFENAGGKAPSRCSAWLMLRHGLGGFREEKDK